MRLKREQLQLNSLPGENEITFHQQPNIIEATRGERCSIVYTTDIVTASYNLLTNN